ncbi:unnamed protein product, partial [Ectocarpus sp. 4 AP-2014]
PRRRFRRGFLQYRRRCAKSRPAPIGLSSLHDDRLFVASRCCFFSHAQHKVTTTCCCCIAVYVASRKYIMCPQANNRCISTSTPALYKQTRPAVVKRIYMSGDWSSKHVGGDGAAMKAALCDF